MTRKFDPKLDMSPEAVAWRETYPVSSLGMPMPICDCPHCGNRIGTSSSRRLDSTHGVRLGRYWRRIQCRFCGQYFYAGMPLQPGRPPTTDVVVRPRWFTKAELAADRAPLPSNEKGFTYGDAPLPDRGWETPTEPQECAPASVPQQPEEPDPLDAGLSSSFDEEFDRLFEGYEEP